MSDNIKIQVNNLSKKFNNVNAVNNISFEVNRGEIVGFVGPNGAGKTTTISMLLGFIKPTAGTVKLFGNIVIPSNAHKHHGKVGFASGDMALFDNLTGLQYLNFLASQYKSSDYREELIKLLKPNLSSKLGNLSRGNKQKIALIGAMQHRPDIVILDEPTSGLDPLMQKIFLEIIVSQKEAGVTIFMSSHILMEVAEIAQRVIFLREGSILIDKDIESVLQKKGKIVSLHLAKDAKISIPENSEVIVSSPKFMQFRYFGYNNELLKILGDKHITDFNVQDETLDDIFDSLYEENDKEPSV